MAFLADCSRCNGNVGEPGSSCSRCVGNVEEPKLTLLPDIFALRHCEKDALISSGVGSICSINSFVLILFWDHGDALTAFLEGNAGGA